MNSLVLRAQTRKHLGLNVTTDPISQIRLERHKDITVLCWGGIVLHRALDASKLEMAFQLYKDLTGRPVWLWTRKTFSAGYENKKAPHPDANNEDNLFFLYGMAGSDYQKLCYDVYDELETKGIKYK